MTTTTGFGPSELRYLKRLETALLVASRRDRAALLDLARRHVGERPPASSYDDLLDELGPPEAYARQLMADEGVDPEPPRWRRLAARFRSRESMALTIGAVVVAGAAAWFLADWYTEAPTIDNNCSGAGSDDPSVPIERVDAAGEEEVRVGYVDGAEVRLVLCLGADERVEVLSIEVPDEEWTLFRTQEVLLLPGDVQVLDDALSFEPFTIVPGRSVDLDDPTDVPDPRSSWQVLIVGELTDCELRPPGSWSSFDSATLTYRFRGRTRTMPIDLNATYAFEAGSDEACPRRAPESGAAASPGGT